MRFKKRSEKTERTRRKSTTTIWYFRSTPTRRGREKMCLYRDRRRRTDENMTTTTTTLKKSREKERSVLLRLHYTMRQTNNRPRLHRITTTVRSRRTHRQALFKRCIEMRKCAGHRDARCPHDGRLRRGRAECDTRSAGRRDADRRKAARRRRRIVQRRHHRRERINRRCRRQIDISKSVKRIARIQHHTASVKRK